MFEQLARYAGQGNRAIISGKRPDTLLEQGANVRKRPFTRDSTCINRLNIDKRSTSIPSLTFNGEHAEDDEQKANMLMNDKNKHPPQLPLATDSTLESIKISEQNVKDVLDNLEGKHAVQTTLAPVSSRRALQFPLILSLYSFDDH